MLNSSLSTLATEPLDGMLRLRPRRARRGVHIDMTPMVDVAFLLVIFFMVTAVFRKPKLLDLDMPTPDRAATLEQASALSVKVREDGRTFWQLGNEPMAEVPEAAALHTVLSDRATADPNLVVLVKVDAKAPYRKMVDVLDEVELAKISRVTALSLEGPERDEVNGLP
jgi:biopolymer transport protein ExbD